MSQKTQRSRFLRLVFFRARFVEKGYILQQKCLNGQKETCLLGTRWNNFYPCTPLTLRATMHTVALQTGGRTDGQHDDANSRSCCVAVRSAS